MLLLISCINQAINRMNILLLAHFPAALLIDLSCRHDFCIYPF